MSQEILTAKANIFDLINEKEYHSKAIARLQEQIRLSLIQLQNLQDNKNVKGLDLRSPKVA